MSNDTEVVLQPWFGSARLETWFEPRADGWTYGMSRRIDYDINGVEVARRETETGARYR
jgi:hypothetical protein